MFLKKIIREKVVDYLNSNQWSEFFSILSRGTKVRHAHLYIESVLHPESIEKITEAYLEKNNIQYKGKKGLLSFGKGHTDIYYIQPKDMCHFEIMSVYNNDIVMEPMSSEKTREGHALDYWDDDFMQNFYKKYSFKEMGKEERKEVKKYFQSDDWKQAYVTMVYTEENVHSHCFIETSLHPEEILPIGKEAIELNGWEVDRAVSIVFSMRGLDIGKITYLLSKPDIVLELEWKFNSSIIIKPGIIPIGRIVTKEKVQKDMKGVSYINLNEDDLNWIKEKL